MRRVLIAVLVLAPLVVFGAALVLLAKAVAGSWTWGPVLFGAVILACSVAVTLIVRWTKRNPGAADNFTATWGRGLLGGTAFGSGGWEPSRKREGKGDD